MFTVLKHWFAAAAVAYDRRRAIESLGRLTDAQLRDIGIQRGMLGEHVRDGLPSPSFEAAPMRQRSLQASMECCG